MNAGPAYAEGVRRALKRQEAEAAVERRAGERRKVRKRELALRMKHRQFI